MKTIAIVGGGFAGTTLLRELDGRLPRGYELLLLSDESYTTFNPLLPEALGASVFPEQVVAPIRPMVRTARFVMGRVNAVDPVRRTLRCETLAGTRDERYEHLLLAFGNRARLDLLPGLAEHGLDKPAAEIAITTKESGEGAVEKTAVILVGKTDTEKKQTVLKNSGLDYLFRVDSAFLDDLPKTAADWKAAPPEKTEPEKK